MTIIMVIFIAPYFTNKGEHIKLYKNYIKPQSNIIILYSLAHHTHIILSLIHISEPTRLA